jgi:Permeases of the drug/metabolite transporter (DMT) superfamily
MIQQKTKTNISMAVLLLVAAAWGLGYTCVGDALNNGWSNIGIFCFRGLIGGTLCMLFAFKEKWWKKKALLWRLLIIGFITFLGYYLQTEGQIRTSIPNTAFFTALNVVMVPFLATIFFKEKLSIKSVVAAVVALAGITILSFDGTAITFHLGDLLNFLCAVCFAIQIAWIPSLAKYDAPFSIGGIQLLIMGVCNAILIPFFPNQTNFANSAWLSMIYLTVITSFGAFVAQAICQKYVKSSMASLLLGQESFFGAIFAVLITNSPVTWQLLIGGFLVVISIVISYVSFNFLKKTTKKPINEHEKDKDVKINIENNKDGDSKK